MHTFEFKKLVRDKIPEILGNLGVVMDQKTVSMDAILGPLKCKLQEECAEVMEAKTQQELIEELADVIEVVQSIARTQNIPMTEIKKVADTKNQKKGSFKNNIYIETVAIPDNHPALDYYRANSDKYPEIDKSDKES